MIPNGDLTLSLIILVQLVSCEIFSCSQSCAIKGRGPTSMAATERMVSFSQLQPLSVMVLYQQDK